MPKKKKRIDIRHLGNPGRGATGFLQRRGVSVMLKRRMGKPGCDPGENDFQFEVRKIDKDAEGPTEEIHGPARIRYEE